MGGGRVESVLIECDLRIGIGVRFAQAMWDSSELCHSCKEGFFFVLFALIFFYKFSEQCS